MTATLERRQSLLLWERFADWIIKKNQKLFVGGTINRAAFDFELEFFKFIK